MMSTRFDRHVVLIVDDVPDNLAVLSDALDESGHIVLVATDGASALERLQRITPDLILLDAVMPGMDGFETCRRIKLLKHVDHVPVVFMTGLTETEHVVKGFEVGGIDYVTKPIRPQEVVARIGSHIKTARMMAQARGVIDALEEKMAVQPTALSALGLIPALEQYRLTPRETDVLNWLAKGKTNRDIAEILGMSPRTVNKHLEHIFIKLGVETRSAAAGMALNRQQVSH